jgi:hypothetical protein
MPTLIKTYIISLCLSATVIEIFTRITNRINNQNELSK